MASAWVGGGVMRIFAGSARNSWSRGRAVPPIAGQACLGLGSRAGSGMASAELNSDLDFGGTVDSPYKQGAPNDRNSLQPPAVGPDAFGRARCGWETRP
jgi:transcription elongation factor